MCLVRIELKPTFIGLKSGASCKYLTSISQAGIYRLQRSVWVTPQTEKVIVLSKILALSKSLALLLSVISRQQRTIEQYRSGFSCHNNFLKAKDAFFTCAKASLEYYALVSYLNVFYLPSLKDVVGHYKLWNEMIFWVKHKLCATMLHPIAYTARSHNQGWRP